VIFGPTKHGTLIGKFTDRFGAECSIQESSYQEEDCIWLGVETDSMGESLPNGRMHLTRERARELILVLRHFVETGALGVYDRSEYHLGRWVVGVGDDNNGEAGIWHCSWERVGDVWVPTDPPPQGRSLFDHLDD
jgi:hypothetical protein